MPRLSTNAVSVFSGKTLRMTPSRSNIILSMSMLTSLDGVSFFTFVVGNNYYTCLFSYDTMPRNKNIGEIYV